MDYLHIDPLKIDFAAVTEMMSSAYATRFRILPVGRDREGSDRSRLPSRSCATGSRELAQILQARDQARDRQPARHRALPGRVLQPREVDQGRRARQHAAPQRLSQLRAAGRARARRTTLDANDQHVVSIVDWLWQYAFEQRASDIHLEPRREPGIVRFRIDGVLHQVYQIPTPVLAAMTSRIKILGAHGRGREAPAAGRPHQDAHARTATRSSCASRRCRPRSARSW